jgi:ribosomal protein L19
MSIHPIMQKLAAKLERTDHPAFGPGDTVRVQVKIREGEKERLQAFEGMVIATNKGPQGTFTVRKMSFGQGVAPSSSTCAVCVARPPVCTRSPAPPKFSSSFQNLGPRFAVAFSF